MDKGNNYKNNNQGTRIYLLLNQFFNFSVKYPDNIKPNHAALFSWLLAKNNKLFWQSTFGLPTREAMARIGIKDPRSFRKTLKDLEAWGLIEIVKKSRNQYQANMVSLLIRDEEDGIEQKPEGSLPDKVWEEETAKNRREFNNKNNWSPSNEEETCEIDMPMEEEIEEDDDLEWLKNFEPCNGDD